MSALAAEIRRLTYTVICFQCLLQLAEGSPYQKYLKLFSHLLTLCICCSIVFSLAGQVEDSFAQADEIYAEWEERWREMTETDGIREGSVYYEQGLWEDRILDEAYREYGSMNGGEADEGGVPGPAGTDP